VLIVPNYHAVLGEPEMFNDPSSEVLRRYPPVNVDNKTINGSIEHNSSSWPFIIFCFANGSRERAVGWAYSPPMSPDLVMSVRESQTVAVGFGVGQPAPLCQHTARTRCIQDKPENPDRGLCVLQRSGGLFDVMMSPNWMFPAGLFRHLNVPH
jgi:hypothetical protein